MAIFKSQDFVNKVKDIAQNYKTVYCWGSFGFPITQYNIDRLAMGYPSIYTAGKKAELQSLIGKNYFAFDCVGLIKGVLWGFSGNANTPNGGTTYVSNGVNDIDCNSMFNLCSEQSANFSTIVPGEFLWMQGHIGVYIGDGLAVEATASWDNKVMITAVGNIGSVSGYKTRSWTKHGKSPYIDYSTASATTAPAVSSFTIASASATSVAECKNIYLSAGIAAKRKSASTAGALDSRCVRGNYYVASQIVTPANGSQKWFRHAETDLYSAITDIDGSTLFTPYGTYTVGITNAPVNVRALASITGTKITQLGNGLTVYLTGKTTASDGYTWAQIVYNGKLCYCDKQWINC